MILTNWEQKVNIFAGGSKQRANRPFFLKLLVRFHRKENVSDAVRGSDSFLIIVSVNPQSRDLSTGM